MEETTRRPRRGWEVNIKSVSKICGCGPDSYILGLGPAVGIVK